ncbi:uncharacterized protein LOC121110342 [Gallus gallus]|uniref:uncharacterized protein LOC121110342 n=1 Tax=Gallus gallus TaxID=9031 RepID=UPI001AEAC28A|nr:uncharacterized protein LOC121110342 [Gallus gallus]
MVVDSVLLVPSLLLLVAGVSLLTAFWRRQGSDRRRQWWRWWQHVVSLKSGESPEGQPGTLPGRASPPGEAKLHTSLCHVAARPGGPGRSRCPLTYCGSGPLPVLQVLRGRQAGAGAPCAGHVAPSSKHHHGRAVPSCPMSPSQERPSLCCSVTCAPLFTPTLPLVPRGLRGNPAGFPDRTSTRRFWWHVGPPGCSVSVRG